MIIIWAASSESQFRTNVPLDGPTIVPPTFKATLNGTDITREFSPTPGGHQLVPLALVKGSNVLVLSVDARTVSGLVATDTDRLVLLVP